jgi:tripartite ATP-independent transporter DctP family solute receptor
MSWFRGFLILIALGLGAIAVYAGINRPQGILVKVAAPLNRAHPSAASLLYFQERLEELSGGAMTVDLFFNSQLGSASESLELCRMGDVEMTMVSVSELTPYVPLANAIAMPFIWEDTDHQFRALDGEIGAVIRREARPRGMEVLAYLDAGTRNITTLTGPIERPEDLSGMNIRVLPSPLMVATIQAIGAGAMVLNMGEVYTGLQMGVIDGWENNPTTIATYRMWETGCIYFAWTHHLSLPDLLIAGGPFYESLDEQQRQWLEQAAVETGLKQRELWLESEERSLQQMKENGMYINEVDPDAFRDRVQPLYEEYFRRYGAEFRALCEQIEALR